MNYHYPLICSYSNQDEILNLSMFRLEVSGEIKETFSSILLPEMLLERAILDTSDRILFIREIDDNYVIAINIDDG